MSHDPSAPAPVIAFANHKGGCAKTTSVANIGAALAQAGHRVLIVDADPQANLSESLGVDLDHTGQRLEQALSADEDLRPWTHRPEPRAGRPWPPHLHLLPCSDSLEAAVTVGASRPGFAFALRDRIDRVRPNYDAILIDTPPGLGPLSSMAMLAAQWVVVPARPADLDIGGAVKLAELIEGKLSTVHPTLGLLGVLVTQSDRRWTLTRETTEALADAGIRRLRTEIPFRVRVGAAARHGVPTVVLEPDSLVSHAYRTVADDLLRIVRPTGARP